MNGNCFVMQEATPKIIEKITNFCSECYEPIQNEAIIFYDMKNYRYLCEACKNECAERLDENCELTEHDPHSLFS